MLNLDPRKKVGVLGGGQLGRMLIQAAVDLDVKLHILDPSENAPCATLAHAFTVGSFADEKAVLDFGAGMDVLTVEIEHVSVPALKQLEAQGVKVFPQPHVLEIIQDKGLQKQFYADHGIPTAPFSLVEGADEVKQFPIVQKLRTGGYDGRGVQILKTEADRAKVFAEPSVLEDLIPFEKEISIIASRNESGEVKLFPAVEMVFNPVANLVEFLFSPADIPPFVNEKAHAIAEKTIKELGIVGVLAIEMFVLEDGEVIVNEMAPRPHNSGHQTIEGNITSQYQQHLRAILDLPLGDTAAIMPSAMVNLLGEDGHTGPVSYDGLSEILGYSGVYPHIYGKADTKPFRKMGHVTVMNPSQDEVRRLAELVKERVRVVSAN